MKRDEKYWDEVERAVGAGTRSVLWGTPTRSLKKNLARLKEQQVEIFIVITDDRHCDTEVTPFAGRDKAVAFAEQEVSGNASHPELIEPEDRELTGGMIRAGWIWYCRYSVEGDSVRVVRRELRI